MAVVREKSKLLSDDGNDVEVDTVSESEWGGVDATTQYLLL